MPHGDDVQETPGVCHLKLETFSSFGLISSDKRQ